jgi:NTP pyrophosphatase (non-canonical NTP hydrolase)
MSAITNHAYENSRSKGFHDHGDELRRRLRSANERLETSSRMVALGNASEHYRTSVELAEQDVLFYERCVEEHYGNRLMLIVSEAAEALEQIREGRGMTEAYTLPAKPGKPEGVPSELADIIIRVQDLAGETGLDLDSVVAEKMAYNSTRPPMHGKKF